MQGDFFSVAYQSLTLERLSGDHVGQYKCVVSNGVGNGAVAHSRVQVGGE